VDSCCDTMTGDTSQDGCSGQDAKDQHCPMMNSAGKSKGVCPMMAGKSAGAGNSENAPSAQACH